MTILGYESFTISAIRARDLHFKIPTDYVPPEEYPLEIDFWRYKTEVLEDKTKLEEALYHSLLPLLQENIPGYTLGSGGNILKLKSIMLFDTLSTANFLYSLIREINACIEDETFLMAISLPICCSDSNKIIYKLREL